MYRDYRAETHQHNFGTSYLKQLFALSDRHGADLLVITTLPDTTYDVTIDRVTMVNIPIPTGLRGLGFHRAMIDWARQTRNRVVGFRASAVLLTAGQNYFFVFDSLRRHGITLLISLHCVLAPKFGRPPASWRLLQWLNARSVFRHAAAIMAVSGDVIEQVRALEPSTRERTSVFRPTYARDAFAGVPAPDWKPDGRFRLLFVGRAEANKGVFDLVTIAKIAREHLPGRVQIDICGGGSALAELERMVASEGLGDCVRIHGECAAAQVREFYGTSHAVIVPTTSTFEEGYNKVCAEAILAGRPVITSAVCPALADVRPAAIEVPPDDAQAYADAVIALASDSALYAQKVQATAALQQQYYDSANSYGAVLESRLRSIGLFKDAA